MNDPKISAALGAVWSAAASAKAASDPDAALKALNAVWFAMQDAQTLLINARAKAKIAAWEASLEHA